MPTVWVVDHGAHGDVEVVSRFPSPEAAARHVRDRFGAPFRVDWEPLDFSPDRDEAVLVGAVAELPGHAAHTVCFCMWRVPVGGPDAAEGPGVVEGPEGV